MSVRSKGKRVDFDAFSKGVALLALLLSIGNLAWAWISKPARDMEEQIDDVDERIDRVCDDLKAHDRRIQRTEDDLRHLPTKNDLHAVEKALAQVETKLNTISATVNRVDDYLRNHQ